MSHEFSCRYGQCVECCTIPDMIPMTIGDLYRVMAYENGENAKNDRQLKGIYSVWAEKCGGWSLIETPRSLALSVNRPFDMSLAACYPIFTSKLPCPNLDAEKKLCKGHDKYKYIFCQILPEFSLLSEGSDLPNLKFAAELGCIKDSVLSADQRQKALLLSKKALREIHITSDLLGYGRDGLDQFSASFCVGADDLKSRFEALSQRMTILFYKQETNKDLTEDESRLADLLREFSDASDKG